MNLTHTFRNFIILGGASEAKSSLVELVTSKTIIWPSLKSFGTDLANFISNP